MQRPAIWACLLLVITFATYIPALRAGFIWDDDAYVSENSTLRDLHGLGEIWTSSTANPQYYPLVFTSFWVEYHLWGLKPAGYHIVNVLLHAFNAILVWRILHRLGLSSPWLVAAVFALHPVQVESVAWVTERKNVLSGFFYLAAALAYLRFNPMGTDSPGPRRWGWYVLSLLLFVCALLSKTVACSLPAALVLVSWWKSRRIRPRELASLIPMFVLGAALAAVTVSVERNHVGARGVDWELTAIQRVFIAGRAVWFYLEKLLLPANLTFIYPRWDVQVDEVWQYIFPAAFFLLLLVLWRGRGRWGRGPLVAMLFFAGTLVPALGFIDTYPMRFSFVADHFQYLASLGALALLVEAGAEVVRRHVPKGSHWPSVVAVVVLAILGSLTFVRCSAYADLETIWTDTLEKNPDAWIAHNNLGEILIEQGKIREALHHFQEAAWRKPDEASYRYNTGKAEWMLGNFDAAIHEFREAIRLEPEFAVAHFSLGRALWDKGLSTGDKNLAGEARKEIEVAVRIKHDFSQAHTVLGNILDGEGKLPEALEHFQKAAELSPDDPRAFYNLALTYAKLGDIPTALQIAEKAYALRPSDDTIRFLYEALRREHEKK